MLICRASNYCTYTLFVLSLFFSSHLDAQHIIRISGEIASKESVKGDSLFVKYCNSHSSGSQTLKILNVKIDSFNRFSFELHLDNPFGRLSISQNKLGIFLFRQLIQSGDNVYVKIQNADKYDSRLIFSGKGSAKYNYAYQSEKINQWNFGARPKTDELTCFIADSLMKKRKELLREYRPEIDSLTALILDADLMGYIYKNRLSALLGFYHDQKRETPSVCYEKAVFKVEPSSDLALSLSLNYTEYLIIKEKEKYLYSKPGHRFTDEFYDTASTGDYLAVYNKLRDNYSGILRDVLITSFLADPWERIRFFRTIDTEEYTRVLMDASRTVKDSSLNNIVVSLLNGTGLGSKGYEFLLQDSTGKEISFAEFKGKVVLLDIWANPCGGCLKFKRNFGPVYQKVKSNADFVVVSVNINDRRESWLNSVSKYSDPDFINLTTGTNDHEMVRFYNVTLVPTILLFDRNGKIFSSSMGVSTSSDVLLKTINEALATPYK